jgi:hypothetical protein
MLKKVVFAIVFMGIGAGSLFLLNGKYHFCGYSLTEKEMKCVLNLEYSEMIQKRYKEDLKSAENNHILKTIMKKEKRVCDYQHLDAFQCEEYLLGVMSDEQYAKYIKAIKENKNEASK